MRIVVTGGAGFLGSHLCDFLLGRGDEVLCLDDFSSGRMLNLEHLASHPRFAFRRVDVSQEFGVDGPIDAIVHLASPASPPDYHARPLETLAVGSRGTENTLELALSHHARFVLASTSEVYGDPLIHPQPEDYWGNVNSVGPRSVYDEAKRFAEAITMAYRRTLGVNTGIVRIFNTYGPRMRPQDGRVVSSFASQALNGDPLTIYGDGSQTRSFCYVEDLIRGLAAMIDSREAGPINLGNPEEHTVLSLAHIIRGIVGSSSPLEFHPLPTDDPVRRRPVIEKAAELLGWAPRVTVRDGLARTVTYFQSHRDEVTAAAVALAGAQFEGDRTPEPGSPDDSAIGDAYRRSA